MLSTSTMGQVDLQRHCIGARHRTPARLPYIKHIVESSLARLARQNEPEEPRRHLAASPADRKAALAPSVAAEATTYQRPSTQISASQQLVSSGVGAILTSLTSNGALSFPLDLLTAASDPV